jgi:hypothetical protein
MSRSKVDHGTKIVVTIMQEFAVHGNCTHIGFGIPLDMMK